jgi:hypothetical protein
MFAPFSGCEKRLYSHEPTAMAKAVLMSRRGRKRVVGGVLVGTDPGYHGPALSLDVYSQVVRIAEISRGIVGNAHMLSRKYDAQIDYVHTDQTLTEVASTAEDTGRFSMVPTHRSSLTALPQSILDSFYTFRNDTFSPLLPKRGRKWSNWGV